MPPLAAERLQRHKPDRGGGELEVADQQLPLLLAPLPLDRTRSDASLATEDTQWPTPFSHQSSAWLGKFSDSRNRLAPLCLHGGAQRGGRQCGTLPPLCVPSQ